MKQLDPVDWGYELDRPLPPERSELWRELKTASMDYHTCAVGEVQIDRGINPGFPQDRELVNLGGDFPVALISRNCAECKQIRTKIRKRFDELYGRIRC